MAVTPQNGVARPWPVVARRWRARRSQPKTQRVLTAREAESLERVGELPRRTRTQGTAERALMTRQRWF
jgi:hypothetical protein